MSEMVTGAMSDTTAGIETGMTDVDAVVASIEALEDRPVEEHVAVFEAAHEQLRRALDDAPEQ